MEEQSSTSLRHRNDFWNRFCPEYRQQAGPIRSLLSPRESDMRLAALASVLLAILPALDASAQQSPHCRCPGKASGGPGGGVDCEQSQYATCDPSGGECNCACHSLSRGLTKKQYFSKVLSDTLSKDVTVESLQYSADTKR